MVPFSIGDCGGQIIARPFSLYRLQDAMDIYAAMDSASKAKADALLAATGADALREFKLAARLGRANYKLVLKDKR